MIRIEVDDRAVKAWLGALIEKGRRPPMRAIGHALAENARLRFRESRGPDGQPWAPLSPATIARRRQGSSKPLLDTGRLRNSITYATEGQNAVVVGTNVRYGRMQQQGAAKGEFGRTSRGSPIPWGRVPGRPYLGVGASDRRDISEILTRDFESTR